MAHIASGSHISIKFSDGTTVGYRTESDLPVDRVLQRIRDLADLGPEPFHADAQTHHNTQEN